MDVGVRVEELEVVVSVYKVENVEYALVREDIGVERVFNQVGVDVGVLLADIGYGVRREDIDVEMAFGGLKVEICVLLIEMVSRLERADVVQVVGVFSEEDGLSEDGSRENVEDVDTEAGEIEEVEVAAALDGEGDWEDIEASSEVLEDVLKASGAGIMTVTGGELTSTTEYFVAVVVATEF